MPFIAIALLLAAAIGGGTSVAAQHALPGEALWNFKVGVNERIGAALAASAEAQAHFDIAVIEARMQEAAKLAAEEKLTAETKASLEENFELHAKSVQEQIAKLESDGNYATAAETAARFQAAVASNASTLAEANNAADAQAEVKAHLGALITKVRGTLDTASTLSANASAKAAANATASAETASGSASGTAGASLETRTEGSANTGNVQVDTGTRIQLGL